MTRNSAFKLARSATRQLTPSSTITRSSLLRQSKISTIPATRNTFSQSYRLFSSTPITSKGLSPESEDPHPKPAESNTRAASPAELTIEEYHKLSDEYIDAVVSRMEQLQEERDDVDVEYSVSISLLQPYLPVPIIRHNILISITGRCSQPHISSGRHICNQQATAKQADLALIPHLRPKTI
jgi:frataxin